MSKAILKILRHFAEEIDPWKSNLKNELMKVFNSLIENNNSSYEITFLVLKQIIWIFNDKARDSQDLTECIFPFLHIFSSFRFLSCNDYKIYNEAQKNLNHAIKRLLQNRHFNEEHKEIIFKSFVLPINEDIKLSLNSPHIKHDFTLFSESSSFLIDVVVSMGQEHHLLILLKQIQENLNLDELNQNKIYKVELHFF